MTSRLRHLGHNSTDAGRSGAPGFISTPFSFCFPGSSSLSVVESGVGRRDGSESVSVRDATVDAPGQEGAEEQGRRHRELKRLQPKVA